MIEREYVRKLFYERRQFSFKLNLRDGNKKTSLPDQTFLQVWAGLQLPELRSG